MQRMLRVPSAIAEYTLGTMIVLFHLSVVRPLEERARQRPNKKRRRSTA
jgi:hypothetical protein